MTGELLSIYRIKCQINVCINRDGVFGSRCVSGECNRETRMSERSWVFKLQLEQEDKKSAWNRERTPKRLSRHNPTKSERPHEEEPSEIMARFHTHCHATLYTTQPWWTLMPQYPNAAPTSHHSLSCIVGSFLAGGGGHDAVNSLLQSAANSRLQCSAHPTWQPVKATLFPSVRHCWTTGLPR